MDSKRLDIVHVVERRRKWPAETIALIMEEALAPGATVASSAACAAFVPVKVQELAAPAPLPVPQPAPASRRRVPVVEITLGNGRAIKVDEEGDPAVLARLAAALDGGKR